MAKFDWPRLAGAKEINWRQYKILQWAADTFGPVAYNRIERASRLVEEALELGQAGGLSKEVSAAILDRVYSRPVGGLRNEIGGLGVTIYAFAEAFNQSAEDCIQEEIERVTSIPKEHWQRKHAEKVAAGTAVDEERYG